VLVQTILSQNTSDTNSGRAFRSLKASFPRWEDVASADVNDIADAIRSGGLAEIKAGRIKQALGEIQRQRGRLELDFLNELPLDEAREWLKRLPGVGTKTSGHQNGQLRLSVFPASAGTAGRHPCIPRGQEARDYRCQSHSRESSPAAGKRGATREGLPISRADY